MFLRVMINTKKFILKNVQRMIKPTTTFVKKGFLHGGASLACIAHHKCGSVELVVGGWASVVASGFVCAGTLSPAKTVVFALKKTDRLRDSSGGGLQNLCERYTSMIGRYRKGGNSRLGSRSLHGVVDAVCRITDAFPRRGQESRECLRTP